MIVERFAEPVGSLACGHEIIVIMNFRRGHGQK
jgi:hypothetical protein